MLRNIKLTIEYDGSSFYGWQIQSGDKRTIQGEIETALKKIFREKIRLIGAGRTDSGVHAQGQVANFKTKSQLKPDEILKALNANLPDDIVILNAQEVESDFHAQYDAKGKVYRYTILNRDMPSAQQRSFYCFYPHSLNVSQMSKEAKVLVGKKDFKSFAASDPARRAREKNTIRTIKKLSITHKGSLINIEIEANGFLYKMVRNIVGALLSIGSGRLPLGSLKEILKQKDRRAASKTATAKGLSLIKVKY